jgi:hypothetical protein
MAYTSTRFIISVIERLFQFALTGLEFSKFLEDAASFFVVLIECLMIIAVVDDVAILDGLLEEGARVDAPGFCLRHGSCSD